MFTYFKKYQGNYCTDFKTVVMNAYKFFHILELFDLSQPFDGSHDENITFMMFTITWIIRGTVQYAEHVDNNLAYPIRKFCQILTDNTLGEPAARLALALKL